MSTVAETQVMPDTPPSPVIDSYESADAALLQLGRVEALLQKTEASLNTKLQKVRDEYELTTRTHVDMKEQIIRGLEEFCCEHQADFAERKTRDLTHGTIGFRMSPPTVLQLSKKFPWKTIMELLRKTKWGTGFVRTKSEIDKEAIKTAFAAKEISEKSLAAVGIKVDQADNFVYDIKWDSIQ
jgi:phage host-nuclease inhibitor protein Gam